MLYILCACKSKLAIYIHRVVMVDLLMNLKMSRVWKRFDNSFDKADWVRQRESGYKESICRMCTS